MGRAPAVTLISPGILHWDDLDFGLPHLVSLGGVDEADVEFVHPADMVDMRVRRDADDLFARVLPQRVEEGFQRHDAHSGIKDHSAKDLTRCGGMPINDVMLPIQRIGNMVVKP